MITQTLTKLFEQGHLSSGRGPRSCVSVSATTGHLPNLSALLSSFELAFGLVLPAYNAMFSACRQCLMPQACSMRKDQVCGAYTAGPLIPA